MNIWTKIKAIFVKDVDALLVDFNTLVGKLETFAKAEEAKAKVLFTSAEIAAANAEKATKVAANVKALVS